MKKNSEHKKITPYLRSKKCFHVFDMIIYSECILIATNILKYSYMIILIYHELKCSIGIFSVISQ